MCYGSPVRLQVPCRSIETLYAACRICFAYGRDKLLPFPDWWGTFNYRLRTPVNAVWGVALICLLLGLPMIGSTVAFESLLSLSTIALFILYAGKSKSAAWIQLSQMLIACGQLSQMLIAYCGWLLSV